MKIRWSRIIDLARAELAGRGISARLDLHASSGLPDDLRANVQGCPMDGFNILLNLDYCKNEEDIIKALAHELAHIVQGDNHNKRFWRLVDLIHAALSGGMKPCV